MKNLYKRGLVVLGSAAVAAPSFAQDTATTLGGLANSFDSAEVKSAVLAVAAALVAVYVTIKGATILMGMIKR